jgi:hypothetical protein
LQDWHTACSSFDMLRVPVVIAVLLAGSVCGEQPRLLHDQEDVQQAGSVHLRGVTEADEVRIDGEVVNARGLARSNYRLLLAPGKYEISVKTAETGKVQEYDITVSAARPVVVSDSAERTQFL